ncbi:NB-ARC domain-containing protein [Ktedonospora formicarum]|uniref:HTH cro/C1-type domain-containing protein n=1 Tax=Ktedonospora formicarum TaxID=2778364 RepID=A0A8J3MVY6_9CHLR|nr:NB-ARC domain-containing protein [Ktedonospora formicarum]GHO46985.1 hypothetical protein KSX_51480 [Ktedonospora formicarum]
MPKIPLATLAWSPEHQAYLLSEQDQHCYLLTSSDEPFWFSWLDTHASFSFRGISDSLNLHREARTPNRYYWYAYRRQGQRVAKKYLGQTSNLSLARLEETAKVLGNKETSTLPNKADLLQGPKIRRTSQRDTRAIFRKQPTKIALKNKPPQRREPNVGLKRARLEHGWSQQEVADLLEVPYTYMVARWENGTVFPGPAYRKKLCQLFNKSEAELGLLRQVPLAIVPTTHTSLWPVSDPATPLQLLQTPRLIGREAILAQIVQHCQNGDGMRLALTGLPGVGKTTLAAALVNEKQIQQAFPAGVLWAELGPQPYIPALLSRWSTLLGINREGGSRKSSQQWREVLRDAIGMRRLLIILDDAWTLEDALACQIGGPCCVYLLTTRLREVASQFAILDSIHLSELDRIQSIEFLTQCAPVLRDVNQEILNKLVQASGGLPLALKLMGTHITVQTRHHQPRRLSTTLTRLQNASERLQLGLEPDARLPVGTPLTLQTMIQLSEARLTAAEKQALTALSVFPPKPHSFSEEAALFVTRSTQSTLDRLVDIGLVEVCEDTRYYLHQTIADYARTKQRPSKKQQAERHLIRYVMEYVEQHQEHTSALDQESHIIFTALEIAQQFHEPECYIQVILHLTRYLHSHVPYDVIFPLLQQAYAYARLSRNAIVQARLADHLGVAFREHGNYLEAEQILREGLTALQNHDLSEGLQLLSHLGSVFAQQDRFSEAASCFEETIATAERLGDARLSFYYADRGVLGLNRRDLRTAEANLLKAYHLAKGHTAHAYHFVMVLQNLGVLYTHKGELNHAHALFDKASLIIEAHKFADNRAIHNYRLGEIAFLQGAYTQANSFYGQALEQASALNLQRWLFWIRLKISLVAIKIGDFEAARDALQQAETHTAERTRTHSECQFLMAQGRLTLAQEHLQLARSRFLHALEQARHIEHSAFCSESLILLGIASLQDGDLSTAHSSLQEGLVLANTLDMPQLQGEALLAWGKYALQQQDYAQAQEQFEMVIHTIPHDFQECMARAHMGLALVARAKHQYEEARSEGKMALVLFEQMHHVQAKAIRDFLHSLPAHF